MIYRNNQKEESKHSILSATRPKELLSLNKDRKVSENKCLDTGQVVNVFIDVETNRKFIESFVAYAIGLTNVRAVMLDNPKYYEINTSKIEELENKGYEVNYIELPKRQKHKIKVYYYENKYYIDMATAYVLGYIKDKEFYDVSNGSYLLDNDKIEYIKKNYDVEYNRMINERNKKK